MVSYIIYIVYNFIYQILSIGFLFFSNTYLNSLVIPDSFRWKDGKLREDLTGLVIAQTFVLILEATLLTILLYYINKWYISQIVKANNSNTVVLWTVSIYAIITLVFIIFLIYTAFK